MIEALDFIILVIIITAGSLAFVVLINLIEVNISERTREIATLKVLGFRPGEVNSYLFKEILLLSIIGGLLGLPLGVIEHHFIMNVINREMIMFGMNISLFSFSVSFFITILFTLIVLFFTRKHLREIRMVESLKSVE
jgi:putative ABC transport system permease protein